MEFRLQVAGFVLGEQTAFPDEVGSQSSCAGVTVVVMPLDGSLGMVGPRDEMPLVGAEDQCPGLPGDRSDIAMWLACRRRLRTGLPSGFCRCVPEFPQVGLKSGFR